MADNHFIITTTENIPGKEYEVIGEVFGLTTQSKNVVRNIGAGLKKTLSVAKSKTIPRCLMKPEILPLNVWKTMLRKWAAMQLL